MFQDYSIKFLNLVVLQCDAMNVFSHTGVLDNPKSSGQTLLKETLFIFPLTFLLNIEAIFRNYVRGCITSIPAKKKIVFPNEGKNESSMQGIVQKKSLHSNIYKTDPTKIYFHGIQNFL